MSKDEKDNPITFVRVEDCRERHGIIQRALFGDDMRGGIVKDIGDIKSDMRVVKDKINNIKKEKWSARDKAIVIGAVSVAVIEGLFALALAILKL